jgi:hypothetical protein
VNDDIDFSDTNFVDDLLANCSQLRERCWKAENELFRWQQIAIEERVNWLYAIESTGGYDMMKVADLCDKEVASSKRSQAARELNLQVTREAGYVEQLEKDFIFYARSYEYLRNPDTWKPHQERYEAAEQKAQTALTKIREGK